MNVKIIDLIAGARPNFMKIAPIIEALRGAIDKGASFRYRLIHTGQHYDRSMSESFFEQLGIPEPDINLEVGSGTQAEQTAAIMVGYEKVLKEKSSDLCLVVGDVTSTMACAIVARKQSIPVAHVEGGIRSHDWTMPEEINRVVTDAITNWFFTTSEMAGENLRKAGIAGECIFFVGNTMIDTLLKHMDRLRPPTFWNEYELSAKNYIVVTLHRPSNVDGEAKLLKVLETILSSADGMRVIFPVHPRTAKKLKGLGGAIPKLYYVEPQGYLEFNYLVKYAMAVITDSGGVTEEATVMGVPCLTLRDSTERPETVTVGTNELVGTDPEQLKRSLEKLLSGKWKKGDIPELWDGNTARRIVDKIIGILN